MKRTTWVVLTLACGTVLCGELDIHLQWQRPFGEGKKHAGRVLAAVASGSTALIADSANTVWAMDTANPRPLWEKHFGELLGETAQARSTRLKKSCGGFLTAGPAFVSRDRVLLLTGDGLLRQLNPLNGEDLEKPRAFVPAGAAVQRLQVDGQVVYASTRANCGHPAALWALSLAGSEATAKSVKLGANVAGVDGLVLGDNGKIFVETEDGPLDAENGKFGDSLIALRKDLTVESYFILPSIVGPRQERSVLNQAPPLLFHFKGVEMALMVARDGCLYLLKAQPLGGEDHHHYVSKSAVIPVMDGEKGHGVGGTPASWQDPGGSQYVMVSVWGPLSSDLRRLLPEANVPTGSVVTFRVGVDKDGVAALIPVWVSPDLQCPMTPVVSQGVVYALGNGLEHKGGHARLIALDAASGKLLYSSGDQVAFPGNMTGLTVADGQVYFVTADNKLQVFGPSVYRESIGK